jgi:hypothetical protein
MNQFNLNQSHTLQRKSGQPTMALTSESRISCSSLSQPWTAGCRSTVINEGGSVRGSLPGRSFVEEARICWGWVNSLDLCSCICLRFWSRSLSLSAMAIPSPINMAAIRIAAAVKNRVACHQQVNVNPLAPLLSLDCTFII